MSTSTWVAVWWSTLSIWMPIHAMLTVAFYRRRHLFPIRNRYPNLTVSISIVIGLLMALCYSPAALPLWIFYMYDAPAVCTAVALMAGRAWCLWFQFEIEQSLLARTAALQTEPVVPGSTALPWKPGWHLRNWRLMRPQLVFQICAGYFLLFVAIVAGYVRIFPGDPLRDYSSSKTTEWDTYVFWTVISGCLLPGVLLVALAWRLNKHPSDGFGVKSEFKQLAVCVSFGIVIFSLLRLILGDSRLTDQIGTTTMHVVLASVQIVLTVQPLRQSLRHEQLQQLAEAGVAGLDLAAAGLVGGQGGPTEIKTVKELLQLPGGEDAFLQFLVKEFSSENLLFYRRAEDFRTKHGVRSNSPTTTKVQQRLTAVFSEAESIYDTYLADLLPFRVACSADLTAHTKANLIRLRNAAAALVQRTAVAAVRLAQVQPLSLEMEQPLDSLETQVLNLDASPPHQQQRQQGQATAQARSLSAQPLQTRGAADSAQDQRHRRELSAVTTTDGARLLSAGDGQQQHPPRLKGHISLYVSQESGSRLPDEPSQHHGGAGAGDMTTSLLHAYAPEHESVAGGHPRSQLQSAAGSSLLQQGSERSLLLTAEPSVIESSYSSDTSQLRPPPPHADILPGTVTTDQPQARQEPSRLALTPPAGDAALGSSMAPALHSSSSEEQSTTVAPGLAAGTASALSHLRPDGHRGSLSLAEDAVMSMSRSDSFACLSPEQQQQQRLLPPAHGPQLTPLELPGRAAAYQKIARERPKQPGELMPTQARSPSQKRSARDGKLLHSPQQAQQQPQSAAAQMQLALESVARSGVGGGGGSTGTSPLGSVGLGVGLGGGSGDGGGSGSGATSGLASPASESPRESQLLPPSTPLPQLWQFESLIEDASKIFVEAQLVVLKYLQNDAFVRFRGSGAYKALMARQPTTLRSVTVKRSGLGGPERMAPWMGARPVLSRISEGDPSQFDNHSSLAPADKDKGPAVTVAKLEAVDEKHGT